MDTKGTCFIIQPFDDGAYDRRCHDVFEPAIRKAGFTPHRVDQGHEDNLIEAIHTGIHNASVVFAEISERNPNVWYELGFATAAGKEIVRVRSSAQKDNLPFDVRTMRVIPYDHDSRSDFDRFEKKLVEALKAAGERSQQKATWRAMSSAAPVGELSTHESITLQAIAGRSLVPDDSVPVFLVQGDVENAGFTAMAVSLALRGLIKRDFIVSLKEQSGYDDNSHHVVRITEQGQDWLIANQAQLQLRLPDPVPSDEDYSDEPPF